MSGKENFQAVPSDMDYDSEEEYHDDIEDKHDIQERVDDSTSNVPTNELSPLSSFLRKDVTSSEYERVNHDSDDDLNALTETDTTFESEDDEDFVYSKEGGNYVDVDLNDDKKDIATNRQEIDENKEGAEPQSRFNIFNPFARARKKSNNSMEDLVVEGTLEFNSLDFEFEEDEYDYDDDSSLNVNLSRYSFDFSSNNNNNQKSKNNLDSDCEHALIPTQFKSFQNVLCCCLCFYSSTLFMSTQEYVTNKRKRAQQRHAERALAISGTRGDKVLLCLETWCDLWTNQGLCLAIGLIFLFVFAYRTSSVVDADNISVGDDVDYDEYVSDQITKLSHHRSKWLLGLGITAILLRFFWWPIYWFMWGRRVEKNRQATMAVFDGLNGEAGTSGFMIPDDYNHSDNHDEDDIEMPTSFHGQYEELDNENYKLGAIV